MFGMIGTGNMGGAVARAVCKTAGAEQVMLCNRTRAKAEALAAELGCVCGTNEEAAESCRYLFLGVKPQMMKELLSSLRPILRRQKPVLVSMAAGLSLEQLEDMAGCRLPILRIMPNTPVAVGAGVVLYCANEQLEQADLDVLTKALSGAGLVEPCEERLIDAGSALCGCSPAFTDLYIEALSDGAVACGIPRDKALRYAAAAVMGAAKLALETGTHPGALKDAVCSPGGSTIQGVRALEARAFRSAVFEAMLASVEANGNLGKK